MKIKISDNTKAIIILISIYLGGFILGFIMFHNSGYNDGYNKGFVDGKELVEKSFCIDSYKGKPLKDVQVGCIKYFN